MAMQGNRIRAGEYQFGIYNVERHKAAGERAHWQAFVTGPGTIGDPYVGSFRTLDDAHKHLTGESIHD